ncbi:ArnT family glycosyltransferase [Paracoccus laeviglucosivorans]|uniref:Dolichyl-phosphate-mannose-protein mannosyltransferase n=1 Tax=Paracoccus laeviglucosivorans TaxID=1197861 RepID=A0A521DRL0_9RHOB|nr:glycosyltransferase family 39 protein [Paracoccus laeviglucosivorans]SMO74346.1 Dolichyl-phosphate-mannose-protein mannosyltransferase [Paracoccus laeviglucosivorans]
MQKSAHWPADPVRAAIWAILALTAWRLALMPFSRLELFVDEAQYWLWGRELAFGAYSKPPLVGWLIRAANEIAGSDAPWVARLPWPICHAIAALAVLALGRRLAPPDVAALAGVTYATLPAISLGSLLISTDSPMLMFLALSLLLWHRQAAGAGRLNALALGAAIGLAMMSKYAMLFALAGLAVTAIWPAWRLRLTDLLIVALTALLVLAPNLIWNMQHDMATMRHTAENADFHGLALHPDLALRFLAEQFVVAGPVVFAAIVLGLRRGPLAVLTAAPLLICTLQALNAGANANWAVGAYVSGAILAALVLSRRWAIASLAINGTLALALPLVAIAADHLRRADGSPMLDRYVGVEAPMTAALNRITENRQAPALVISDDRAVLAQLFYLTRRDHWEGVTVRALPAKDRAPNSHYELLYPLTTQPGPGWLVTDTAPACAAQTAVLDGKMRLYRLDQVCLDQMRSIASAIP